MGRSVVLQDHGRIGRAEQRDARHADRRGQMHRAAVGPDERVARRDERGRARQTEPVGIDDAGRIELLDSLQADHTDAAIVQTGARHGSGDGQGGRVRLA